MNTVWGALRARARGDEGASLVLVMVFVIGVGLVVTALLGYSQTAIVSAEATRSRHVLSSDTSGALDAAITTVRHSDYANQSSAVPCPANGMLVEGAVNADGSKNTIRVLCRPEPGSGVSAGTVPITALNRPGSAVLTLGAAGTEAGVEKIKNGPLRIKGRVYVNSNITFPPPTGSPCATVTDTNCSRIEVLENQLLARAGCPMDMVFSDPAPNCGATGTPPESKDPADLTDDDIPPGSVPGHPGGTAVAKGYEQPPSTFAELVLQVVPQSNNAACPVSGNIVEMNPGYYDDAAALTALTTKCKKAFHFKPGVYYFDFRNTEVAAMSANRPFDPGTSGNVWSIANGDSDFYLIGGTRKDWSSTGPTVFPGACVSPLTTTTGDNGVQFVFGGNSRIDMSKGKVELCGQYHTDKPSLVVYGAKSDTTPPPPDGTGELTTTAATLPTPFANPQQAFSADGLLATATIARPNGGATTASIRLTGSSLAGKIPAGSILTSAKLRLVHRSTPILTGDALSVRILPNFQRPSPMPELAPTPAPTLSPTAGLTTNTFELMSPALAREVWRYGLADVRIDYTVTAAAKTTENIGLTADLDGAQLLLEWKAPSLRGQTTPIGGSTNCVGAAGGCALIATGGQGNFLYLQGTTYAPRASFSIDLNNVSGQVFRSGIIARSLRMAVNPNAYTGPVIEVPDEKGSGVSVDLEFSAYACPPAGACPADPIAAGLRRVGRTTVELESVFPIPTNGSRAVTVKSWNVLG